jgi:hypothetical protein
MPYAEYSSFLAREYLQTFIAEGGSAVKFATSSDGAALRCLRARVSDQATQAGFKVVCIDAARIKVTLIQQLFFAVSREIEWRDMADRMNATLARDSYPRQVDGRVTIKALAEANQLDEIVVRRDMGALLTRCVLQDHAMATDFRVAMTHLCLAELDDDALARQSVASLLDWLRGELRFISSVKDFHIHQRIARHNARSMLTSAAHWLKKGGQSGLVLILDMEGLAPKRKSEVAVDGIYYTVAGLLDVYEILRQFIDATDEMEGIMLLVTLPEVLLDDDPANRRSVPAYKALRNRIWDEVRDRRRVNPYMPLVRLTAASEDVS